MCVAIALMLLQAVAQFIRNVAEARGAPLPSGLDPVRDHLGEGSA